MNSRRWSMIAVLVVAIALGAGRDFLFTNLNYQLDHVSRGTPFSYAHSLFRGWVEGWSLRSLLVLKWSLALLFIGLMYAACHLLLLLLNADRRTVRAVALLFIALPAIALVLHACAKSWPVLEEASVNLLHAVQYPVLPVLLWAAQRLLPTRNEVAG
jgi:hypothetical protein